MQNRERRCLECNAKLHSRNSRSRRKKFTNLCAKCFANPPMDKTCKATTVSGKRCSLRISKDCENFCRYHKGREIE